MYKVSDFEEAGKQVLTPWVQNFYYSASEEGHTYRENFKAIHRYLIKPRMLRSVSHIDTTTTVLGHKISFPVCASPTAGHGFAHSSAEIGSASATGKVGTIFTLSAFSSLPLDKVAQACPDTLKFLNIYMFSDKELVRNLVKNAESLGYKALVVTIDAPVPGPAVGKKNFLFEKQFMEKPYTYGNLIPKEHQFKLSQFKIVFSLFNPTASWEDLKWLKSITNLPLIIKGVLCAEDAELAVEYGAAGILISNHGGRQLGSTTSTIEVLTEVVKAVRGRCEVYIDGGFRTGTDVIKALALGARAVFIGRPIIYALAHGGAESVEDMFDILRAEFKAAMAMSGCRKISDVTPALVRHKRDLPAKL